MVIFYAFFMFKKQTFSHYIGLIRPIHSQFYKDYTTNVYGRQAFKCYTCTNDNNAAGSRGRYTDSAESCGYGNEFNPANPNVQVTNCYTYCMVI
jgi:hypothetical protein